MSNAVVNNKEISNDDIKLTFNDYYVDIEVISDLEIDVMNYQISETNNFIILKNYGNIDFRIEKDKMELEPGKLILKSQAEFKIFVDLIKQTRTRTINVTLPNIHSNVIKSYYPNDPTGYDQDTWMNIGGYENRNTNTKMGYVRSFMVFSLPAVNASYGNIVSAKLQMSVAYNENNKVQSVNDYVLRSAPYFDITNTTWNNQPTLSKSYGKPVFVNVGSLGSHEYNVTSYIKAYNSDPSKRETFGFYGPEDTVYDGVAYDTTLSKIIITQESDYCPATRPLPNNLKWSCKISDVYANKEIASLVAKKLNLTVNDKINKASLDKITSLELSNLSNKNFTDLNKTTFNNLSTLKLNNMKLRSLDTTKWLMPKLTTLDIQFNEFDVLPSAPKTVKKFVYNNQTRVYNLGTKSYVDDVLIIDLPKIYPNTKASKNEVKLDGKLYNTKGYFIKNNKLNIYLNNQKFKKVELIINNGYNNGGYSYIYQLSLQDMGLTDNDTDKVSMGIVASGNKCKGRKESKFYSFGYIDYTIKYGCDGNKKEYVESITKYGKGTLILSDNKKIYYILKNKLINDKKGIKENNIIQTIYVPKYAMDSNKKHKIYAYTAYKMRNGYRASETNQIFKNSEIEEHVKKIYNKYIYKNIKDSHKLVYSCFLDKNSMDLNPNKKKMIDTYTLGRYLNICKMEEYLLTPDEEIVSGKNYSERMYNKIAKTKSVKKKINGKVEHVVQYYYNSKQQISTLKNIIGGLKYEPTRNYDAHSKAKKVSKGLKYDGKKVYSYEPQVNLHPARIFLKNIPINYTSIAWKYDNNRKWHPGIDAQDKGYFGGKNDRGQNFYAQFEGKVLHVSEGDSHPNGMGNHLIIVYKGADSLTFKVTYGHMFAKTKLKAGDNVSPGQLIGVFGSTGNSTGAHIHSDIEVSRFNWGNYFIDKKLRNFSKNVSIWMTGYLQEYSVIVKGTNGNYVVFRMYPETFYAGMNTDGRSGE